MNRSVLIFTASSKLVTAEDSLFFALDTLVASLDRLPPGSIVLVGDSPIELLALREARARGLAWVIFRASGAREQRDGKGPAYWGHPTSKSVAQDRAKALAAAGATAQYADCHVEALIIRDPKSTEWSECERRFHAFEGAGLLASRYTAGLVDLAEVA